MTRARIKTLQLLFWIVMGALTVGALGFVIRLDPGPRGGSSRPPARSRPTAGSPSRSASWSST